MSPSPESPRRPRRRQFGLLALVLSGAATLGAYAWWSDRNASSRTSLPMAPVAAPAAAVPAPAAAPVAVAPIKPVVYPPGMIGEPWLARFDAMVAGGDTDLALRSALILLQPNKRTRGAPRFESATRQALFVRLAEMLPHLSASLAVEVAQQLRREKISGEIGAKLLVNLDQITDDRLRANVVRTGLNSKTPAPTVHKLLTDADPRVRAAAGHELAKRADHGDPEAREALKKLGQTEPDPRVRQALDPEQVATVDRPNDPGFGEDRERRVLLPPAAERAPPRTIEALWDPNQNHAQDPACHSTISIDDQGRVMVETTKNEDDNEPWHVRYPAWAWKDGAGNLIIDARDQPVEHLDAHHRGWSPDSFTIAPDGTVKTIDDWHQKRDGNAGMPNKG